MFTDKQLQKGLVYVKTWLAQKGFSSRCWDGESEDGHWLVYCLTEADGSACVCCQEPILKNAIAILEKNCGWGSLHLEALSFVMERAAME